MKSSEMTSKFKSKLIAFNAVLLSLYTTLIINTNAQDSDVAGTASTDVAAVSKIELYETDDAKLTVYWKYTEEIGTDRIIWESDLVLELTNAADDSDVYFGLMWQQQ